MTSSVSDGVAAQAAASPSIVVSPNVQVSKALGSIEHEEVMIGADVRNHNHLIACSIGVFPKTKSVLRNLAYMSFDGGTTWRHTLTVADSADPSCAIGVDGIAQYASDFDSGGPDSRSLLLRVHRSLDGGLTWNRATIGPETQSIDREYITVDDTAGRFRGRSYVPA